MKKTLIAKSEVYFFDTVTSTIDVAYNLAESGAASGTVVIAEQQSCGRGRRGRKWVSEPGNLYLTYIYRPYCSLKRVSELSFVTCVILGGVLRKLISNPLALKYKWPNDLLFYQKKLGGILLETKEETPKNIETVFISCGLNLKHFPLGIPYPVTSFEQEGEDIDVNDILPPLCEAFYEGFKIWKSNGFISFRKQWMEDVLGIGSKLSINQGQIQKKGQFVGIDDFGALLLLNETGVMEKITAGDVLL